MNLCGTHNQWYSDFCVYCGPPQNFVIAQTITTCPHEWQEIKATNGNYVQCQRCYTKKFVSSPTI